MVGTMIPIVYREHTMVRSVPKELVIHTLASAAGGTGVGLCLACLSTLLSHGIGSSSPLVGLLVGFVAILASLKEADLIVTRFPESRWQVPRDWSVTKSPARAAGLYGFFLGAGMLTRMSPCLYPVLVWAVFQARPVVSVATMLIFGLSRTFPMWLIYFGSETRDTEYPLLCISSLSNWQPAVRLVNAFILVHVGTLFAVAWLPFRIGYFGSARI